MKVSGAETQAERSSYPVTKKMVCGKCI